MMNCLESRRTFAAFWRQSLAADERTAVTSHLAECARCDHSFRVFALTAPILHGAPTAPRGVRAVDSYRPRTASRGSGATVAPPRWGGIATAFAFGAAAAVALYFSAPRRVTFEDAIGVTTPADAMSLSIRDSLFGQSDHSYDSEPQMGAQHESRNGRDDLAS